MEKEIWKDIDDYNGLYQVSNLGNVKNIKTGRVLKMILRNGYYCCHLSLYGKSKIFYTHRLVAMAFIPNQENKPFIDHINTIRTDNRVENLRWVTRIENNNNPITKSKYVNTITGRTGKQHNSSKSVLQFDKNMNFIKKWDNARNINSELNIAYQSISKCCLNKLKTSGGYKWGYADDYERIPFKVFDLEIYRKKVV